MTNAQKPDLLYQAFSHLEKKERENVEIVFIGNYKDYKPFRNLAKVENVIFKNYMPHSKVLRYMCENIDIGFVSLTEDYYGLCVPSKIYEYINLGLPMIAALPEGDGRDIINSFNYGIACDYRDIIGIKNAILKFKNCLFLGIIKENVVNQRDVWSMKNKISELHLILSKLL